MKRQAGTGAALASLAAACLALSTFTAFDPVRLKIVRKPAASAGGPLRVEVDDARRTDLPDSFAVIWRVRNTSASAARFTVRIDALEVCSHTLEPAASRRLDCSVRSGALAGPPSSLTVHSNAPEWALEYAELATHHGGTTDGIRAFVLPRDSRAYLPPSVLWIAPAWLLIFLLWVRTGPTPLPKPLERAYKVAAAGAVVLLLVLLVTPFILPFRPVLSVWSWLALVGLLSAPRLWTLAMSLAGRVSKATGSGRGLLAAARRVSSEHPDAVSRLAVTVFAVSLAAFAWFAGVKTASAADNFGYISQAYLWLDGIPIVRHPSISLTGVEHPVSSLEPLGYVPGPEPGTLVPTYPPGLPLMMAGALAAVGTAGPFLVTPLFAAILVLATYALGRRFDSRSVGIAAAALVACSPTVLFMALLPMSDIPAAALWTLSLVAASGSGRGALTSGILAGLAIAIRPNLAPLAVIGAALVLQQARGGATTRVRTLAIYGLSVAPFVLLVMAVNRLLYGSALTSGYGELRHLYGLSFMGPNVRNYTNWFVDSRGLLFSLLVLWGWGRAFLTPRLRALAWFATAVAAIYVAYRVFDAWWFLRFFLPAYPPLFVMAMAAAAAMFRRTRQPGRSLLALAGFVLVAAQSLSFAYGKTLPALQSEEYRYAAIAEYVRESLPLNAAFVTQQHSGSLRFYAARLTVRYDWLNAGELEAALRALENNGYEPYLLIDEGEEPAMRARFTAPGELSFLDRPPDVELLSTPKVRIYRLRAGAPSSTIFLEPSRPALRAPVLRPPVIWVAPAAAR